MPRILTTLQLTGVALFLPGLELVFARFYLHSFLNLRIGFSHTTDFDYLLPVPTAFFVLFYVLQNGQKCRLFFSRNWLEINLAAFSWFLLLNHFFVPSSAAFHSLYMAVWFILLGVLSFSGLFVFIPLEFFLKNRNRWAVVPCAGIALSIFAYRTFFPVLAKWISPATSQVTHKLLQFFFADSAAMELTQKGTLRIDHSAIILRLGHGCAGGDAFFYFLCVFFIWFSLRRTQWSLVRWAVTFLVGLECMFLLNVLRIFALFGFGLGLMEILGPELGRESMLGLFHTHLGWILYSVGIGLFIKVCSLNWTQTFRSFSRILERSRLLRIRVPLRAKQSNLVS